MASKRAPSISLQCQWRSRPRKTARRQADASNKFSTTAWRTSASGSIELPPRSGYTLEIDGWLRSHGENRAHGYNVQNLNNRLREAERRWRTNEKQGVLEANSLLETASTGAHESDMSSSAAGRWVGTADSSPVPHELFRERMRVTSILRSARDVRFNLRMQLLHCYEPKDILRVVAVALQREFSTHAFASLYEPLMRAIFRCRRKADDRSILAALTGIIDRLHLEGAWLNDQLFRLGLKFAARVRDLRLMKKYLKAMRTRNIPILGNLFRTVIAKCSIGSRGLGERRNGRWRRSDLLQVMTGFHDCTHLPPEEQYHLGTWYTRNDWAFTHGWTAALARCRDRQGLLHEWEMWKKNDDRIVPKMLTPDAGRVGWITSKRRGDHWFVEQMCNCGDLESAWAVLRDSDMTFRNLKEDLQLALLDGVEFAGAAWSEDVRHRLLDKYDHDLGKIEKALGIAWVPTDMDDDAEGHHVLVKDQEEVLDRLGSKEWKFEEDYGYPWDETCVIVSKEERRLHNAATATPAPS